MYKQIALVKTGWSDHYEGGPVVGRHAHVQEFSEAHERFNFLQHEGRFYGYLPPIGRNERPPQPKDNKGWLLLFVSARNGSGPLTVVGWYEDATFHNDYLPRPEYSESGDFELDVHGSKYGYCISAPSAHLIPTAERTRTVSGDHFKRTPVLYVRGNGKDELWRENLAQLAESIVSTGTKSGTGVPRLSFPDPALRKKVEEAAIDAAKSLLRKSYRVTDRQKDNCGYDLLAKHRKTNEELHVEVKGTSGEAMHFYMSRNEYRYMPSPQWRLIMVCDALGVAKAELLTAAEVRKIFSLEVFAWEATVKK
jgi:hypothetical protein